MDLEKLIFYGLIHHLEFNQKVIIHLKSDYFDTNLTKTIFEILAEYHSKYYKTPTQHITQIEFDKAKNLRENEYQQGLELIDDIYSDDARQSIIKTDFDWLYKATEEYCKRKSLYKAILDSSEIIIRDDKKISEDAILSIVQGSLAVSFDNSIGHDYLNDADKRFEYYHKKVSKHKLPLTMFNHITRGGYEEKTLNLFIAPTGVGKTLMMCYLASQFLIQGHDILYVTLEMAEEKIAERIDAALFNCDLNKIADYSSSVFFEKIDEIKAKTGGNLLIKEYATSTISANNIRALINEIKIKKNFKPTILFVDYLSILLSSRIPYSDNSFERVKSIAEELRALAKIEHLICISAAQTNRKGQNNSDYEITEIAESQGLSNTADSMLALISTDELDKMNQMKVKQLKNRYNKIDPRTFLIGVNRDQMSFFDVDKFPTPDLAEVVNIHNKPAKENALSKFYI